MALNKRVIGLDIHQAQITACVLIEEPDGSMPVLGFVYMPLALTVSMGPAQGAVLPVCSPAISSTRPHSNFPHVQHPPD